MSAMSSLVIENTISLIMGLKSLKSINFVFACP